MRLSTRWWTYSAVLALAAVAAGVLSTFAERNSFWELLWGLVPWQASSAGALAFVPMHRRGKLWWTALIASMLSMAVWMTFALMDWSPNEPPWREIFQSTCGCIVVLGFYLVTVVAFVQFTPRGRWTKLARWGVFAAASAIALTWMLLIVVSNVLDDFDADWVLPAIVAASITAAALALWLPAAQALDALARRAGDETLPAAKATLAGRCPRCGKDQSFARGESSCQGCGLRVTVEFEESRCACGYLLYKLTGDTCPECGRKNPQSPDAGRAVQSA